MFRGGVGPGDKIDLLNETIIMRTCRSDGRLLLPDWPALATPIQMLRMAFSGTHSPRDPHAFAIGEIWRSATVLNDRYVWPLLFCSEVGEDVGAVTWKSLGLTDTRLGNVKEYLLYSSSMDPLSLLNYPNDLIHIPKLDVDQFMTLFMAPLWTMGTTASGTTSVALLGEMQKYVPISRERIWSLQLSGSQSSINVGLRVSPYTFLYSYATLYQHQYVFLNF